MKTSAKFIVLHPSVNKSSGGGGAGGRAWLTVFILFFIFTFGFTLINTRNNNNNNAFKSQNDAVSKSELPKHIFDALVYYASVNISIDDDRMTSGEVNSIAAVLRDCAAPCNFLIFGITHETLLWNSLNQKGRTVFVDERTYLVSTMEEKYPYIEAYDVQFTTKVSELYDLIEHYRREIKGECRPVQNLLFSDCKLAINDLPNQLYDVAWDVILVDGPKGNFPESAGRMAPIYTAGVLARSKRGRNLTNVFVHEFERDVESVCSEEFLCRENLVEMEGSLSHFIIPIAPKIDHGIRFEFCSNSKL